MVDEQEGQEYPEDGDEGQDNESVGWQVLTAGPDAGAYPGAELRYPEWRRAFAIQALLIEAYELGQAPQLTPDGTSVVHELSAAARNLAYLRAYGEFGGQFPMVELDTNPSPDGSEMPDVFTDGDESFSTGNGIWLTQRDYNNLLERAEETDKAESAYADLQERLHGLGESQLIEAGICPECKGKLERFDHETFVCVGCHDLIYRAGDLQGGGYKVRRAVKVEDSSGAVGVEVEGPGRCTACKSTFLSRLDLYHYECQECGEQMYHYSQTSEDGTDPDNPGPGFMGMTHPPANPPCRKCGAETRSIDADSFTCLKCRAITTPTCFDCGLYLPAATDRYIGRAKIKGEMRSVLFCVAHAGKRNSVAGSTPTVPMTPVNQTEYRDARHPVVDLGTPATWGAIASTRPFIPTGPLVVHSPTISGGFEFATTDTPPDMVIGRMVTDKDIASGGPVVIDVNQQVTPGPGIDLGPVGNEAFQQFWDAHPATGDPSEPGRRAKWGRLGAKREFARIGPQYWPAIIYASRTYAALGLDNPMPPSRFLSESHWINWLPDEQQPQTRAELEAMKFGEAINEAVDAQEQANIPADSVARLDVFNEAFQEFWSVYPHVAQEGPGSANDPSYAREQFATLDPETRPHVIEAARNFAKNGAGLGPHAWAWLEDGIWLHWVPRTSDDQVPDNMRQMQGWRARKPGTNAYICRRCKMRVERTRVRGTDEPGPLQGPLCRDCFETIRQLESDNPVVRTAVMAEFHCRRCGRGLAEAQRWDRDNPDGPVCAECWADRGNWHPDYMDPYEDAPDPRLQSDPDPRLQSDPDAVLGQMDADGAVQAPETAQDGPELGGGPEVP
jgi:predicted RNA-binding Zn-ribbon protein involved in translation (DUF1610 family)